ncbi:MAG: DUF4962 domain-containing protein, partial [Planctomycetota bacterium]
MTRPPVPTLVPAVLVLAALGARGGSGDLRQAMKAQLDRRPAVREKPFAPAHRSTVATNPPAFVWLPPKKRPPSYTLQVAPSRDFPRSETLQFTAPISVHIPTEPLATGTWHWRVGVRLPDKAMVWSKARSFTVPEDAQVWPFPEMDAVVASVPKEHPRLLFPGRHLEEARKHARGLMRRELDGLVRSLVYVFGISLT